MILCGATPGCPGFELYLVRSWVGGCLCEVQAIQSNVSRAFPNGIGLAVKGALESRVDFITKCHLSMSNAKAHKSSDAFLPQF